MNPWHDPRSGQFASGPMTLTVLQELVFACHDASCRPPNSGGTGGSRAGGEGGGAGGKHSGVLDDTLGPRDEAEAAGYRANTVRTSDETLSLLFPGRREEHKSVNPDGTFSIEGMDQHGNFTKFSDGTEKALQKQWDSIGPQKSDYVENFVTSGKLAMGLDPKTNKLVDPAQAAEGKFDSKWYGVAHEDVAGISRDTGIPETNVTAATTTLSAGRLWSGVANGNVETARRLAEMTRDNPEIEITQAHLDFMAWRLDKSAKSSGQAGLSDFPLKEPGKVKFNDLDSASAVEAVYSVNALRGYSSFADWAAASKFGVKTPKAHSAKVKGVPVNPPPYPLFTSKGTQQVKQAVSLLRGDVTPREGLSGPKYSSFYSNIRRPDKDYSSTNDTWHYRIMAGNMPLTGKGMHGTIQQLTVAEKGADQTGLTKGGRKKVITAQDIFQTGVQRKDDHLENGDGMFRDTTIMARQALDRLKVDAPAQFSDMKLHEFQALIWVDYGGGKASKNARMSKWDSALEEMARTGR